MLNLGATALSIFIALMVVFAVIELIRSTSIVDYIARLFADAVAVFVILLIAKFIIFMFA